MSQQGSSISMHEPAGPPAPVDRAEVGPAETGADRPEPSAWARPEPAQEGQQLGERSEAAAQTGRGQEASGATTGAESRPIPPPESSGGWGNTSTYLAIFGFVVLLYTLLRAYRRSAARREDRGTPREQIQGVREDAAKRGRASVDFAAAETLDMIERLSAQLDNKASRLEILLAEADRRIDELHRLRRAASPASHQTSAADRAQREAPGDGADPVRSRVYEMADRGVGAEEIARAVQRPRGQVDLMLALRRV
ncbi:MAG: hypothetical protein JJU33_12990 [Phycisphaerales bacterium]|nr:hypothetical protein [Phycisphaerales bacterium]